MPESMNPYSSDIRSSRFAELITKLVYEQGLNQQAIATRSGVPAQYLSDIKHGRRTMSEQTATKLASAFGVSREWLLGLVDGELVLPIEPHKQEDSLFVPLFPYPIEGEPRQSSHWDGASVEVAGAARARASAARWPYAVRLDVDDAMGRLRRGDLVLVSQSNDEGLPIRVVKAGAKLFFARREPSGRWRRIAANPKIRYLPADCPNVGYVLGIIWGEIAQVE